MASGKGHHSAVQIRQQNAVLWAGRLQPTEIALLPRARSLHLYVATGDASLTDGTILYAGDAARLGMSDITDLEAGTTGTEILIWEME